MLEADSIRIAYRHDAIAFFEIACEDRRSERCLDEAPDHAPHGSRTEGRVVAAQSKQRVDRSRVDPKFDILAFAELLHHTGDQAPSDLGDLISAEGTEEEWLVDSVPKLGSKRTPRGRKSFGRSVVRSCRSASETDRTMAASRASRSEVRCHDDDGVGAIDGSTLAVGQPSILEQRQ